MEHQTIELTVGTGLCSSCGICINMCPKECIAWKREKGMYYPQIDNERCVRCGICAGTCPSINTVYESKEPMDAVLGNFLEVYNAWSRNPDLRHISASGGVVSTLIETLLKEEKYDVAFCVDSYQYQEQLVTKPFTKKEISGEWKNSSIPKSRYLPVSHENAVSYIKKNKKDRVIFVGTSCAIRGMLNVIKKLKLNREQYLLIGLFCDKVFNYNVHNYFEDVFCEDDRLKEFHFKNKESGGWPGNMKLFLENREVIYKDKKERERVKEYFLPERCLYCVDKLNVCADIALGDNYTDQDSSILGSNSVIIRTEKGKFDWEVATHNLEYYPVSMEKIKKAQYIDGRLNNFYFGELKRQQIKRKKSIDIKLNEGISLENRVEYYEQAWKYNLEKLHAGANYDSRPKLLEKQFKIAEKRKSMTHPVVLLKRIFYAIKRRVKGV